MEYFCGELCGRDACRLTALRLWRAQFIINHCGGYQGLSGTCPAAGSVDAAQKAAWDEGITALGQLTNAGEHALLVP